MVIIDVQNCFHFRVILYLCDLFIHPIAFQIGDKVELVDGYERYGDASSGPLQVGDRGIVVDVQRGPNGDTYVIVECFM